ncbi:uncharacterized protein LOC129043660 [Pongo pygmaeus]|uniref:uncharacterized protein LOC129043660 n=1 Tax=Pongo pygmaeus TaxID=9600 RepID=UPI00300D3A5D
MATPSLSRTPRPREGKPPPQWGAVWDCSPHPRGAAASPTPGTSPLPRPLAAAAKIPETVLLAAGAVEKRLQGGIVKWLRVRRGPGAVRCTEAKAKSGRNTRGRLSSSSQRQGDRASLGGRWALLHPPRPWAVCFRSHLRRFCILIGKTKLGPRWSGGFFQNGQLTSGCGRPSSRLRGVPRPLTG